MTNSDALKLLVVLAALQPVATDEVTVRTWAAALDDDLDLGWAVRFVTTFHGNNPDGQRITVGHINAEWRRERARTRNRELARQVTRVEPSDPTPDYLAAREELRRGRE